MISFSFIYYLLKICIIESKQDARTGNNNSVCAMMCTYNTGTWYRRAPIARLSLQCSQSITVQWPWRELTVRLHRCLLAVHFFTTREVACWFVKYSYTITEVNAITQWAPFPHIPLLGILNNSLYRRKEILNKIYKLCIQLISTFDLTYVVNTKMYL